MWSLSFCNVEVCFHLLRGDRGKDTEGLTFAPGGGYMAAGSLSAMENGERIVIAGLAVQLVFFGFFMFLSAVFHYRVRSDRQQSVRPIAADSRFSSSWEAMMWCLYGACILIFVRSVFRVIEFVQGNDGYIMKREYLLYVFDAVLMALQAALLLLAYPGAIVKGSRRTGDVALTSGGESSDGMLPAGSGKREPC
jgi:hypothetical protein